MTSSAITDTVDIYCEAGSFKIIDRWTGEGAVLTIPLGKYIAIASVAMIVFF